MKNWKRTLRIAVTSLTVAFLLYEGVSIYRAASQPTYRVRPEVSRDWRTVGQIGRVSLSILLLSPFALLLRWAVAQAYCAWRTWRRDQIELDACQVQAMAMARREQLVLLRPDEHGFGGVAFDQATGLFHDLDTSESWPRDKIANADPERVTGRIKQGWLAALSGSTFRQRFVQEIIQGSGDDEPQIQIAEGDGWLTLEAKADGGEVVEV